MRKFLVALVAVIITTLSLPAHGQSKFTGPSTLSQTSAETLFMMQAGAWSAACELKRANCNVLIPPRVAYGFLPGAFGMYLDGDSAVLIDIRLMAQPLSVAVMIHEMIHYLQYAAGEGTVGGPNYLNGCAREEEAFTLAYLWNLRTGMVQGDKRMQPWNGRVVLDDGTTFLVHEGYGCPLHTARATAAPPG